MTINGRKVRSSTSTDGADNVGTARTPRDLPLQMLPREAYISEDWLERERAGLFGATWSFVGVVSDFKEPGDYRTVQIGNYSVIVLLGAATGELQAHHNTCRHRGTELLEGCGNSGKSIVCPYHRWTYTALTARSKEYRDSRCVSRTSSKRSSASCPRQSGSSKISCLRTHPAHPDEEFRELACRYPRARLAART